ncbi:MAG: uracil/xanthine transporter [Bacillota bacterium]|nr:uracil/xanthine transporter [Bacillota bacterium]
MENKKVKNYVGIEERLPILETIPLSFQHLFAMFGATVLVPFLFGVDPAVALLMNGIGTIIYSFVTRGKIPAYLGSSFAFIAPVFLIMGSHGGFSHAQSGFIFFGLFFVLMSFIIKFVGIRWIDVVMPPPVMGAVVAVIGLELAPVAFQQAGFLPDASTLSNATDALIKLAKDSGATKDALAGAADSLSKLAHFSPDPKALTISIFTLLVGVIGSVVFRKFFKIIPILTAVVAGYALALIMGQVNFTEVSNAPWFKLPDFTAPVFDFNAILIIAPACLVVLAEHIGHLIVTGNVTDKDLMKDPGLHKSLLGDGLSNIVSGFTGSPPNTTYGENIGVMAITRVYSVWVIRGAAILAVAFSFIGKISALIKNIPLPVMGGVTILLYGIIAASGIRMLVEKKVNFSKSYNLVLGAVTFVIGVSGASINLGSSGVQLKGMAFAAVTGMLLSIVFYILSKLGLMNEKYVINAEE